jgi:hypothetical protein
MLRLDARARFLHRLVGAVRTYEAGPGRASTRRRAIEQRKLEAWRPSLSLDAERLRRERERVVPSTRTTTMLHCTQYSTVVLLPTTVYSQQALKNSRVHAAEDRSPRHSTPGTRPTEHSLTVTLTRKKKG